jgi:hypothetical protein
MLNRLSRAFAAVLAIGGLFWAVVLGAMAFTNGWQSVFGVTFYFGLGYLVWVAWIIRALAPLPLGIRVSIWILSIVYHSAYLISFLASKAHGGSLLIYWWSMALALSIAALVLERFAMPNHSPDPTPAPGMPPAGQESRHG